MKTTNQILFGILLLIGFLINTSICLANQNPYSDDILGEPGDSLIVVYGTNDQNPAGGGFQDVLNVQWAADNIASGGTVELVGEFYFGIGQLSEWYNVVFNFLVSDHDRWWFENNIRTGVVLGRTGKDVTIKGRKDDAGKFLTQIIGGAAVFFIGNDPWFKLDEATINGIFDALHSAGALTYPHEFYSYETYKKYILNLNVFYQYYFNLPPFINATIRDIHFNNFYRECIGAYGFTGLEITGCKFSGGRNLSSCPLHPYYSNFSLLGEPHPLAQAITAGSMEILGSYGTRGDCTGTVIIRDNHVDGEGFGYYDPTTENPLNNDSVYVWSAWWNGLSNGISCLSAEAVAKIENNQMTNIVGTFIASTDYLETKIKNNRLTIDNNNNYSLGILVAKSVSAQVLKNTIDSIHGIILHDVHDSMIKENSITIRPRMVWGEQWRGNGIELGGADSGDVTLGSSNNMILRNDFTSYVPGYTPADGEKANIFVAPSSNNNQIVNNKFSSIENEHTANVNFQSSTFDNKLVAGSWKGALVLSDDSGGANEIILPSFRKGPKFK